MDEADHMGIQIDVRQLSDKLNIPVVPMIASKGRGIREVFITAYQVGFEKPEVRRQAYQENLEEAITELRPAVFGLSIPLKEEAIAIKLLEQDPLVISQVKILRPELLKRTVEVTKLLGKGSNPDPGSLLNLERSTAAQAIAEKVTVMGTRKLTLRDKLDNYLLHPFWGYVFLVLILYLFFQVVFQFGGLVERPLLGLAATIEKTVIGLLNPGKVLGEVIIGLIQGISGGLAIVLPYLIPFLVGLGFLEDLGYLPRVAFLMH
jgi:ferrous iron transport protein B